MIDFDKYIELCALKTGSSFSSHGIATDMTLHTQTHTHTTHTQDYLKTKQELY